MENTWGKKIINFNIALLLDDSMKEILVAAPSSFFLTSSVYTEFDSMNDDFHLLINIISKKYQKSSISYGKRFSQPKYHIPR